MLCLYVVYVVGRHAEVACGKEDAQSSGVFDLRPSLPGACDIRLAIDLILFVSHLFCKKIKGKIPTIKQTSLL